jgi:hypothetical protein
MHKKYNSPTGKLWIWYGENASEEEEKEWKSLKKLIIVGHGNKAVREVLLQIELDNLNANLSDEGWISEIASHRLTKWITPSGE